MFSARQYRRTWTIGEAPSWPWPKAREDAIRADQTRLIVEWLRERSDGIYGTGSYLDGAEGIEREFGPLSTYPPEV